MLTFHALPLALASATVALALPTTSRNTGEARLPLVPRAEDSARHEWENKTVLARRLLDAIEEPGPWKHDGFGAMEFTREHTRDGGFSLRLRSPTKGPAPTKDNRSWGYCSAILPVAEEDWREWNRVALWVYPDSPGHQTVTINVVVNNGKERSRDNIVLKNHEWNHIVSEIEFLPRDHVTSVELKARLNGNEPGASDTFTYYIDELELQRVAPDYYSGWAAAPGHIAYSHSGYALGAPKSALASDLDARDFRVLEADTGRVALEKPVVTKHDARGTFQMLDFSELAKPGVYCVEAGGRRTPPFPVNDDVWLSPLEKALNFYYVLRCGFAVPGVHGASNLDWRATRGEKSVSLVGGWYDAGDLSQGLYNTSEATFVLFQLAERLAAEQRRPELVARLVEEATWGLDWILQTTLHDGYRPMWAVQGWWSDGIVGNADDPHAGFGQTAENFFSAASAEAIAARVLKKTDPVRAAASLRTAIEDWGYGVARLATDKKRGPACAGPAEGVRASLELFRTTGKSDYAKQALALAPELVAAQRIAFVPGGDALSGFLLESAGQDRILHSVGGSGAHEHAQILALAALCETFPDAPEWMAWYAAVARYGDLQRKLSGATGPYEMLPAGVYHRDEYKSARENIRERVRAQLESGLPVGDDHVVRAFPAGDGGFGNQHLLLTQAKGLAASAGLRGDLAASQLAERQLEWTFGRNPFARSFMYGEGHRYLPLYSQMNGDIVGALPVGLPTVGAADQPYWSAGNNQPAPKEVWIQSVTRFVYLAGDLLGEGRIRGRANHDVEVRGADDGVITRARPDEKGRFELTLPQGQYRVLADGLEHKVALLPGKTQTLDPKLAFSTSAEIDDLGRIVVRVRANGTGRHRFALRTENLLAPEPSRDVKLVPGTESEIVWVAPVAANDRAWFAVVVPDGDSARRQEARLTETTEPSKRSLDVAVSVPARNIPPHTGPAFAATRHGFPITSVIDQTAQVIARVASGETKLGITTRQLRKGDPVTVPALAGTPIGVDGLVLTVHANNPVSNLSADKVRAIWTGEIKNWKELGGEDLPIIALGRSRAYDPIRLFADFLQLETQDAPGGVRYRRIKAGAWSDLVVATTDTDAEALAKLGNTPGAVSYFPFQFLNTRPTPTGIKPLMIDGVAATYETLHDGPYLIRRTVTAITKGPPDQKARAFIDFLCSPAGRIEIAAAGFTPLKN